ncbi:hypothetical protein Tco_0546545 [Tanacetum coccineum]
MITGLCAVPCYLQLGNLTSTLKLSDSYQSLVVPIFAQSGPILRKKKNAVVHDFLNSLGKRYKELKNIAKIFGIDESTPLPLQDPSLPKHIQKKRKAMN